MRNVTVLALLALAGGAACGSSNDFTVVEDVPEQHVPGNALGGDLMDFFTIPMTLTVGADIDDMAGGPIATVHISSIKLDAVTALERDCPGGTWSFLDHVVFSVEGQGLPKLTIAEADGPGNIKVFKPTLSASPVYMKPYIEAGGTITAEGIGTAPESSFCYSGTVTFSVHPQ
jgi:hypothetical protein